MRGVDAPTLGLPREAIAHHIQHTHHDDTTACTNGTHAPGTAVSDPPSTGSTKRALDLTSLPQTCHHSPARFALGRQQHPQQNHDSKNDNSLHPEERELKSIGMPSRINIFILPSPLLALACEGLIVKDLLTLRAVNRSFRELSKDEYLWKKLACSLWTSALIDAESSSLADESSAHLHQDASADLTLEEVCRCIAGAWPSHIDLSGRCWLDDGPIQAIVNGVRQPLARNPPPPLAAANFAGGYGGTGGGGSNAHGGSGGTNGTGGTDDSSGSAGTVDTKPEAPAPEATPVAPAPEGLCTGVVFRGSIGGDRAVKANLPFPWMLKARRPDMIYSPADTGCGQGRVCLQLPVGIHDRGMLYPDVFLSQVKSGGPFATLWPGHAPHGRRVTLPRPAADVGGGGGGGGDSSCGGGSNSSISRGGGRHSGSIGDIGSLREELESLPSSGPLPFFHVGHAAYYEITVGEAVEPLPGGARNGFQRPQCVAVGLATSAFPLHQLQPGWDDRSWGFHSDDGLFHHCQIPLAVEPVTFGPGDTVGCGLLYPPGCTLYRRRCDPQFYGGIHFELDHGAIFYTKNGRFLGVAFDRVDVKRPLFPCVGLDSHSPVEFNFGSAAFAFDMPSFEACLLKGTMRRAAPPAPEPQDNRLRNSLRTAYSWENGFTNPRLLYPSIRPLLNSWKLRINGPLGIGIVPESAILRQSLATVRTLGDRHYFMSESEGGEMEWSEEDDEAYFEGEDDEEEDEEKEESEVEGKEDEEQKEDEEGEGWGGD